MSMQPDIRAEAERKRNEARQKALLAKGAALAKRAAMKAEPLVTMPEPTGDAEKDSEAELSAVMAGFKARDKAEQERFAAATDSEYWVCLCFQTREQKEAFLAALNLLHLGDKYLDGPLVAQSLGVELPPADVPYNPSPRIDPAWAAITLEK